MPQNIIFDAKRKAKQLETFDYRTKPKLQDEHGESGGEAIEENTAAAEFLHKFRKLPIDKMSKEEVEATVLPLLKQYGFR